VRLALAAAVLAALGAGSAAAAVRADSRVPVRGCSERGEVSTGAVRTFAYPADVVAGRVAFRGLKRFAARTSVTRSVVGSGKDRMYFVKAGAVVRAGAPVTISIVPPDRAVAALVFVRGLGQGLKTGYPVERLQPCAPSTKASAYSGRVGPLTSFPGGFVVKRPACVTIVVTSPAHEPLRRVLSLGAGTCPASR
jgi:hypothetical protein